MLVCAPYTLPFFLAIYCWAYNDAVPLASYSSVANRMQDSADNWSDILVHSRTRRQAILDIDNNSDKTIKNLNDHGSRKNKNTNYNQNINVNGPHTKPSVSRHTKTPRITTTEVPSPLLVINSANCTSNKKENQIYTSSFGNITDEFDEHYRRNNKRDKVIGNKSKPKKTCSVHEDEDMTLCWIETTTIKENTTVQPPKKLVIREYTISFENSATIPDRYLDCKRIEGELTANDSDIGKTTLFEVIDEDTKISRVVNFTSISHVGDIVIWQHKKVKCGVGPVVTKNIVEWNDGTKIPKKRVEIKVSPKLQQLTVKPDSCGNTKDGTHEVTTVTDSTSTESEASTTEKFVTEARTSITTVGKDCEEDSSDPACITQELTSSITTETTTKSEELTSSIITNVPETTPIDKDKTTEKEASSEETTLPTFVTEISVEESSKTDTTYKPTSKISTPKDIEKEKVTEDLTSKEVTSSSVESTSQESGESTSSEVDTVQTTTETPSFTEYTEESGTPAEILSIISSTLLESTTATTEESEKSKSERTTIGLKTTEEEEIIFTSHQTSSEVQPTTLTATTSTHIDSCENSDCTFTSSSESCESGICGSITTKSCESEECSEERTEDQFDMQTSPAITTKAQPLSARSKKIEHAVTASITTSQENETMTTIDNVFTTMENRRSTLTQTHKLNLRIQVLLEHVNENDEKHNLVEVEKYLAMDENPYETHSDLIEQLKSLNQTVNLEAMNALLNYTSLSNLTKHASFISATDNNLGKSESSKTNSEDLNSIEQTTFRQIDKYGSSEYSESLDQQREAVPQRRRRRSLKEVFDSKTQNLNRLEAVGQNFLDFDDTAGLKYQKNNIKKNLHSSEISPIKQNINDEMRMEVALLTLPGIQEDVSNGLQHMAARLMRKNLINDMERVASADLLDVIADPKDDRIHSRRKRAIVERIGHWSNERINEAPMGGNFRSFTEFILYKILS